MRAQYIRVFACLLILINSSSVVVSSSNIVTLKSINQDIEKFNLESKEQYDLLILTPVEFKNPLNKLADHKNSYGIKTKIITLSEIYDGYYFQVKGRDDAEKIKYFIKDAIEEWNMSYVLLVGGLKPCLAYEKWYMPVRYSNVYIDDLGDELPETGYLSDLYFADIYDSEGNFSSWDSDGDGKFSEWYLDEVLYEDYPQDFIDLYPDVFVGRLPCRNIFEVKTMVNKIINYETQTYGEPWFNKMLVVGGDTDANGDLTGERQSEEALKYMDDFEPIKLYASNGALKSCIDVVKAFNNGCGFAYLTGHGNPLEISTHPKNDETKWIDYLKNKHVSFLFNEDKLPICILDGCHNSQFNVSPARFFRGIRDYGLNRYFHLPNWEEDYFLGPYYRYDWAYECLAERLLSLRKGGAIATIGSTSYTPSYHGDISSFSSWLTIHFFELYNNSSKQILGDLWYKTVEDYIQHFHNDYYLGINISGHDCKVVQTFVLFGDPTLKIGGYPPNNVNTLVNTRVYSSLENGSIINVDDDFNSSTPGWNVTCFNKIQEAIKASEPGYTILVNNGTYQENIIINKKLNILGENKKGTIIDGGGKTVVKITADFVEISNFTILNSSDYYDRYGVFINSNYTIVSYNNISHTGNAIFLNHAFNNSIFKNNIMSSSYSGLLIQDSSYNNSIYENDFKNLGDGVTIENSFNNVIIKNNFSNNYDAIQLRSSSFNIISENNITKNGYTGVYLSHSSNNIIKGNNLLSNSAAIELIASSNNEISNNIIKDNNGYGIKLLPDFLEGSVNNIIDHNQIENNIEHGIRLVYSWDNQITNNNFKDNKRSASFDSCKNIWKGNYWDRPHIIPKSIIGKYVIGKIMIPCVNFDKKPAILPNKI
jgi:nitrous oxidase accessory protein